MIAVAVADLQTELHVGFGTVSWLVSGFYLAACVGQPLMGRVADRVGPRRVFCAGLAIVCVSGVLAPFAPSFNLLLACRILQSAGTSAAYPAGLALIRRVAGGGTAPAGALGALSIANSASAGFGPVLGGALVAFVGWRGIFAVNVPLTLLGLVLAFRILPRDEPRARGADAGAGLMTLIDPLGVVLFSGTLVALLGFLLSVASGPRWLLLPVATVLGVLLVVWELRARSPFFDVRDLARSPALAGVLGQQTAINVVFYAAMFGLPVWLQEFRGVPVQEVGLIMLPLAALGVVVTPAAARLVSRVGLRIPLLIGSIGLVAGSAFLLLVGAGTPPWAVAVATAILGLPNGFNNMGLQAALYTVTPGERMGVGAGLFQTGRYVGAIFSTALLGIVLEPSMNVAGLRRIAIVMVVFAVAMVAASLAYRRGSRRPPAASTGPSGA
jgi:MFS family permease